MAPTQSSEPAFVSQQVSESNRYYLNLTPPPGAPFTVVCGGCERMRPDYRVERRSFPFLAIEYVAEGAGSLQLGGQEWKLQPGMAFAYGPKVPHSIATDPGRPMLKYYVDFAGKEAAKMLRKSTLGRWAPIQVSAPHDIATIFELLQREARGDGKLASQVCDALLPVLLLKLEQTARPPGEAEPRALAAYQRARRYIEEHYLHLRTAEEIAVGCHMSAMYLSRLFRRFAQSGAYQFLLRLKMNQAATLLLDRGLLVKETAAELGFSDAFHFSRVFKRIYGVPPEQFVRQLDLRRQPYS